MSKSHQIIIRRKGSDYKKRSRSHCIYSKGFSRTIIHNRRTKKSLRYWITSLVVYPKPSEIDQPAINIKPLKFWKRAKEGTVNRFSGILTKENKKISVLSEEDLDKIFEDLRKR